MSFGLLSLLFFLSFLLHVNKTGRNSLELNEVRRWSHDEAIAERPWIETLFDGMNSDLIEPVDVIPERFVGSLLEITDCAGRFLYRYGQCVAFEEFGGEVGEAVDGVRRQGEEPANGELRQRGGEGSALESVGGYVAVEQHVGVEHGEVLLRV